MNPAPVRILVVDDDREIRSLLTDYLRRQGLDAEAVGDGRALWRWLDQHHADLIVLDLMLPGVDGLTLCRELRARSQVPILMLTARCEDIDRIVGLELGADDYLGKPFNPRELLARIKTILRRTQALPPDLQQPEPTARWLVFAGWRLDTQARELLGADDVVTPLSGGEYRLLRILLDHPNRILSRDRLMDLLHGRDADPFERAIDVQVSRLRQRLGDDGREPRLIKTVRGEGYVLACAVEALA